MKCLKHIHSWLITGISIIVIGGCARSTPELLNVDIGSPINEVIIVHSNPDESAGQFKLNRALNDSILSNRLNLQASSDENRLNHFSSIGNNYYIYLATDSLGKKELQIIKDSIAIHKDSKRYFVLSKNMAWCNNRSLFHKIKTERSRSGEYTDNNFWTDLEPMFKKLKQEVYFIGGGMARDIGDDGYLYFAYENIHLVGTGIGESAESNVLKINLHENDEISIELHLQHSDSILDLKTYKLPFSRQRKSSLKPFFQKLNEDSY
jgi:hypothetical protein